MFRVKRIAQVSVVAVLIGCLVGGALAKGGGGSHGGGGHGGGGQGGGGGMHSGGSMHASAMHSSGHSSDMRSGGNHSSGMSSAMARSGGGPSSNHMASAGTGSRNSSFRSSDMGSNRHGDGGRQSSFRSADNASQFSNSGQGNHPHNANYDRVVAFMNDRGNDRGDHGNGRGMDRGGNRDGGSRDGMNDRGNTLGNNWGDNRGNDHSGDRGNWGHNGDFHSRFASGDNRFDRHGDNLHGNFRHNADSIRRDFRDRHDVPFRTGWWDHRRFDHGFGPWASNWWWNRPWYWWGWSTAPYLDSWLAFGWDQPCYWDYGPGGYVTYNYGTNQFYQQDQPPAPAGDYYKQVYDLAHSASSVSTDDAAKSDWLPLGVFAVTKAGRQDENWLIQLGVNKQGVLSGTYYNQVKDAAHPLEGMVDKTTHKAAWYFADGTENPMVFETSVDNLTEPQTTVMVHFGPGDVGVWQMVRLERPEAAQNEGQNGQPGHEALPTPPQHQLP
jgi:hypothetical protein